MRNIFKSRKGQAIVEYVLLVLIFASLLLALSKIMMKGYGSAFNKYKQTVEIPYPY
jgi:hypothetical protein